MKSITLSERMLKEQVLNTGSRKRVKLDPQVDDNYNQFGGVAQELDQKNERSIKPSDEKGKVLQLPYPEQQKKYKIIFGQIKDRANNLGLKYKKISDVTSNREQNITLLPKENSQAQHPQHQKKDLKTNQSKKTIRNSNWEYFMAKTKSPKITHQRASDFVAIDCQFVKCGDYDRLARVSLVDQKGDKVYDSYVRPQQRITDYVTQISGITYAHIKNAPPTAKVIKEIKDKILNKIVVGHTTDKDLEICGLQNWKGIKNRVDISLFSLYRNGKKLISLKDLAYKHLGKTIQEGWHSSIEDAQIAMNLFTIHKKTILKELQVI